ncbi:MAG: CdaR family protein [Clostridia bacterium]
MLKRLKNNITMKILSVIIAVLFWFVVYTNENPIQTRQLNISLTPINENYLASANLRILNEYAGVIGISVKGRKSELDKISAGDFIAYLDFSRVNDEYVEYVEISDLTYIGDSNISYELSGSGRIGLSIDRIVAGEVPITVEIIGEPADGFVVAVPTVKPANYAILEIKSLVQEVASAAVTIDVTGLKGTKTVRKFCMVYDENGNIIRELSNETAIDITINIAKEVPVSVRLEGKPADDHLVTLSTAKPDFVLVSGSEEDLAMIEKISTMPINIQDVSETFTATTGLMGLPAGTGFVGPGEVEVTVTLESLYEKPVLFSKNQIEIRWGKPSSLKIYTILNESVEVKVKGRQDVLDMTTATTLSAYIDVSGKVDGEISLPLRFDNLAGVEQVSFPLVDILIQSKLSLKVETSSISLVNRQGGLYDYSFQRTEETLVLKGFEESIALLNPLNINPQINVGELGPGTHTVPVSVTLSEGVELFQNFTTVIIITGK